MTVPNIQKNTTNITFRPLQIKVAPVGTLIPTPDIYGEPTTFPAPWIDAPYVTTAGVTANYETESRDVYDAIESEAILHNITRSGVRTVSMTFLQSDYETMK